MKIDFENNKWYYYDIYGIRINENDYVLLDGKKQRVLKAEDGELGVDATNPLWIEEGRAFPGQFGIYPFGPGDNPIIIEEGEA